MFLCVYRPTSFFKVEPQLMKFFLLTLPHLQIEYWATLKIFGRTQIPVVVKHLHYQCNGVFRCFLRWRVSTEYRFQFTLMENDIKNRVYTGVNIHPCPFKKHVNEEKTCIKIVKQFWFLSCQHLIHYRNSTDYSMSSKFTTKFYQKAMPQGSIKLF